MKDATLKALWELRLLAASKLRAAELSYAGIHDLEDHDADNALENLHMAEHLVTMLENFEKKLEEYYECNYLFTLTMYSKRKLVLRNRYSSDMSNDEFFAWKKLIDSFD